MREYLYIEEESSSMSLTVSQVTERDFAATEDLLQAFSNFIKVYGNYLNRLDDVSTSDEEVFLMQYEKIVDLLHEATEKVRRLEGHGPGL